MAVGTVNGDIISTHDLQEGMEVSVDHQTFEVSTIESKVLGWVVRLVPEFGLPWELEVAHSDYMEPMWEVVA